MKTKHGGARKGSGRKKKEVEAVKFIIKTGDTRREKIKELLEMVKNETNYKGKNNDEIIKDVLQYVFDSEKWGKEKEVIRKFGIVSNEDRREDIKDLLRKIKDKTGKTHDETIIEALELIINENKNSEFEPISLIDPLITKEHLLETYKEELDRIDKKMINLKIMKQGALKVIMTLQGELIEEQK